MWTDGWPVTIGCLKSVCSVISTFTTWDEHVAVIIGVGIFTRVTSVYSHTAPVGCLFLYCVGTISSGTYGLVARGPFAIVCDVYHSCLDVVVQSILFVCCLFVNARHPSADHH